ncbi:MAG: DMT family transporter [Clostridiales Family XIII bacterium]|nr:DMT family transporter [Clostridiales Family XIII bacterium]
MNKKEFGATICIFLTALIWGVAFTFQLVGMDTMGPFTYNGVRFLIGTASLIPVILVLDRKLPDRQESRALLKYGLLCGGVLFAGSNIQQVGLLMTNSAGKAGFITALYIIMVPIFSAFGGKRPGALLWVGAALSMVGIYLISMKEGFGSFSLGDGLLLTGAVFFSLHIIVVDISVAKVSSPVKLSFMQFFICGALTTAIAAFGEEITFAGLKGGIVALLYGGIMSAGVAYTLQVVGQKYVPPTRAAILFSLEALFGVVGAAVLIGETMTLRGYVGCAFIFAGVIISQLRIGTGKDAGKKAG